MSITSTELPPLATFGGLTARGLIEITHDVAALDTGGRWAVCATFEGDVTCARFAEWTPEPPTNQEVGTWIGPGVDEWQSSQDATAYRAGVEAVRSAIARGDVYQVNLCRRLSAALPNVKQADIAALAGRLAQGNPARFGGFLRLPDLQVATASPELFLQRHGDEILTGPIKGTGASADDLTDKDRAENVMIVDLMRNDFGRICEPGTIDVPHLLFVEPHPGLVHLVSQVSGRLRPEVSWPEIMQALSPAGSVSGAPKLAAMDLISDLEPLPRGPYCGIIGWVDSDQAEAELAVAIRTFWNTGDQVHFGTGAGITWGSDPQDEWNETELKARHLIAVASDRSPTMEQDDGRTGL